MQSSLPLNEGGKQRVFTRRGQSLPLGVNWPLIANEVKMKLSDGPLRNQATGKEETECVGRSNRWSAVQLHDEAALGGGRLGLGGLRPNPRYGPTVVAAAAAEPAVLPGGRAAAGVDLLNLRLTISGLKN
jgi:hypothetical protein